MKDAYTWRVTYHDGTIINEYDNERPDGRGFAEIDSSQGKMLELLPSPHLAQPELPRYRITPIDGIPNGAIPIFFRRRRIELDPNTQSEQRNTVHCIGWKAETNVCYLFIFEDGSALLTNDLQAV